MTTDLLAPGPVLTLWDGNGLRDAYRKSLPLLNRARPPIVMLHAGPAQHRAFAGEVIGHLRALLPGIRVWAGIGMDGYVHTRGRGVPVLCAEVKALAEQLVSLGVELVVADAEAAYKDPAAKGLLRELLLALRSGGARVGHTAYDQPTLHGSYPWEEALGDGSPVELSLPQVYAAPADATHMAGAGALARRSAASIEAYKVAGRKGWVREDLRVEPYLQLHNVPAVDTVALAVRYPHAALWAAASRVDAEGERAVVALCALARAGHWGDVSGFQRSAGLTPDGLFGPLTMTALMGTDPATDTVAVPAAPPPAGPERGTGEAIVAEALTQEGKPYVYGAEPSKLNPDPGAFDCSSFASWAVYQATGILFGTSRDNARDPAHADASSYDWVAQARAGLGGCERIAPELAACIPGAIFAMAPRRRADGSKVDGHVAISDGKGVRDGKLVEAHGGAGVIHSRRWDVDAWDVACLVPGVRYTRPV